MKLAARDYADLLRDPAVGEQVAGMRGGPHLEVAVDSYADAAWLNGISLRDVILPAVVSVVAPDPGVAGECTQAADLMHTEAPAAARPWVDLDLGAIRAQIGLAPIASVSLAMLLRGRTGLTQGLIAESTTYSMLQSGPEFARWREAHPPRPGLDATPRTQLTQLEGRLHITLARPQRRNAVDAAMRDALAEALGLAVADAGREVVITGLGPDFCSGGDLDEFGSRPDPAQAHLIRLKRSLPLLLAHLSRRTTFRVHGHCLGAGIELPAFAHRIVALGPARFGLPEVALGLIPGAGGTVSLRRRIGRHRTLWLALSGVPVDELTALQWGLIDEIEPG